jgi:hypothetical protein
MMDEEIRHSFAYLRTLLDYLEENAEREDPAMLRATLVRTTGALMSHGRPPAKAGNKRRGLGYTFDEALIMASLDEYGGSIERAARAHWDGEDEDQVDANIRTLYRHKREIEEDGAEFP